MAGMTTGLVHSLLDSCCAEANERDTYEPHKLLMAVKLLADEALPEDDEDRRRRRLDEAEAELATLDIDVRDWIEANLVFGPGA